jgi:hypothetical protein
MLAGAVAALITLRKVPAVLADPEEAPAQDPAPASAPAAV